VSSSLIYTWRKQVREGKLAGVVPSLPVLAEVQVAGPTELASQPTPCLPGLIRIELPGGVRVSVDAGVDAGALARVFLACGVTDMRKGFDGLAVLVQQVLAQNPHSGALFAFRGKRGHLVKLLWFDGQGLCLFSKRLDRGRFVWPMTATGTVVLTPAQLSMLLEGIDWRRPERTFTPTLAG
jgi:transposase